MTPSDGSSPLPDPSGVAALVRDLETRSGEFAALLRRYGEPAPALRHFGLIQWHRADLPAAIAVFRAALALTPDDPDLWRDLAGSYDGADRPDAAETCARAALQRRPEDARAWLMLAQLRQRAEDLDGAADAFRRALTLDPALGDAHFGLGLIAFSRKAIEAAIRHLGSAIPNGYANAIGHAALAHALYAGGRFRDCAEAFDTAACFDELDAQAQRKQARARSFATIVDGRLDEAVARYADLPGADPGGVPAMLRDAFAALSGYGYREAALQVGRLRLDQDPGDATLRYLVDAVAGRALARAPSDYIESHFDGFAATFDRKLVGDLLYDVPRTLAGLVATVGRTFRDILDLGCGTGLAAAALAPFDGRLTGVDLSGGMLEQAAKRGHYAELVKAEAVAFMVDHPAGFDLVFAADVVNYFGDLEPVFAGAARALRPGGLFAFSIETMAGDGHRLQPSGRFTHATSYVERAASGFSVLAQQATTIRIEAGRPAAGHLLVLRREAPQDA